MSYLDEPYSPGFLAFLGAVVAANVAVAVGIVVGAFRFIISLIGISV